MNTSRFRSFNIIKWLLIGAVVMVLSRWIGRRIPSDWPVLVRLLASPGLMFGLFVFAVGIKDHLTRAMAWLQERRRPAPVWPLAVCLSICVIAGILLMEHSRLIRQDEPTGDEPEYIMLTRSLIDDRDYELEVDIATRVCYEFMSGRFILNGRSIRPPGLPVILIPAYLWGRHLPWPGLSHAIYLFMGMLYVVLGIQLFMLIQASTERPRLAFAITLTAMMTPPLIPYAFHVYPEIPAAVIVLYLFRREFYGSPERSRLIDGVLLAIIPLFHQKYMFLFAMSFLHLATGLWLHRRRNIPAWSVLILPSVLSLVFLGIFFGRRFGVWLPTAPYALNEGLLSNVMTTGTLKSVLAQFLDRKWGLMVVCPLLLFILPGMVSLWRRRPWVWVWWFTMTAGFVTLVSAYPMWWGGFCPPGRFVLPVAPLMWVAVAHFFIHRRATIPFATICTLLFLVLSLFFGGLMMFSTPFVTQNVSPYQYPEESPNGSALLAAVSTTVEWNAVFPAIERNGRWNHILPDALQFGRKDALELAALVSLILIWSIVVFSRRWDSCPASRKSQSWILIPVFFILLGAGFALPWKNSDGLLVRRQYQRELREQHQREPREQLLLRDQSACLDATPGYSALPGAYGDDSGPWLRAPEPRHGIFFPPIFIQDMPDTLWPGDYSYRFTVPIRWLPNTDCGKVGLSVENRLTQQKQVKEVEWIAGASEFDLEVTLGIEPAHRALFKIILYGDTSQYRYKPALIEACQTKTHDGPSTH